MEARIRQLQAMLKHVEIVGGSGSADGSISLGSTVTVRYDGDDEHEVQRFFLGSIEERQGGLDVVSPSSPLGQVLVRGAAPETQSSIEHRAGCSRSTS